MVGLFVWHAAFGGSGRKEHEQFRLRGRFFYLDAPDGMGRSKLAVRREKLLRIYMTDRNWKTASAVAAW